MIHYTNDFSLLSIRTLWPAVLAEEHTQISGNYLCIFFKSYPIHDPLLWPGPGLRNQTNDEKNWNRGAVDRLLLEGQEGEEGL